MNGEGIEMHTGYSKSETSGDWDLIRTFLALIKEGSLSAAARALGISQPTVGRQLDALEDQLGLLFTRTPQGLVATPLALDLVEPAQAMAASWATVTRLAMGRTESLAGTVRLTASRTVSAYVLPPILADLRARWPEIQLELVASDIVQDLLRRDADIAVRNVRPTQDDVIARKVGELAIGLFASPAYVARRGLPTSIEQLLTHELIGFDRLDQIIRGFASAGVTVDRTAFPVRCDDHVVLIDLVAAGLGLGFVNTAAAAARGFVRVPALNEVDRMPVWIATHKEVHTNRRIRVIADALAEGLAAALASHTTPAQSS
jgi:DNA-binding transcriptional LysR family regulator